MKITVSQALAELEEGNKLFLEVFTSRSLTAEIYKPKDQDLQQPHDRDEIYIIIAGTGEFINGENSTTFQPGDFLFVPAGTEHRFVNFTSDFSTWVVFFGEAGSSNQAGKFLL